MRDKDTHVLEEAYASLYAGKIEEEDEDKKDTSLGSDQEDHKDTKKETEKEKKVDKDEPDFDSSDEEKEEHEESETEEDEEKENEDSEDFEDSEDSEDSGGDAGIQSKVKQLKKQYNDLLVDAFERYAAESIEDALADVESSFGENIQDILDNALQSLKGKILSDLGVEDEGCCGDLGGMDVSMGADSGVEFGPKVGGIPTMNIDVEEPGDEESEESEKDEDEDGEVEEAAKKDSKWIKGAVNPSHKGYCTPMSKSTCTPRRKALARRFKKGIKESDQISESVRIAEFYGFSE